MKCARCEKELVFGDYVRSQTGLYLCLDCVKKIKETAKVSKHENPKEEKYILGDYGMMFLNPEYKKSS